MSQCWPTFILSGHSTARPRQKVAAVSNMPIVNVVDYLLNGLGVRRGVALYEPFHNDKRLLFGGAPREAKLIDLNQLTARSGVFPFPTFVNGRFLFVEHYRGKHIVTTKIRDLLEWAAKKKKRAMYLADNEFATFSNLNSRDEKLLFQWFLSLSIFSIYPKEIRIRTRDWDRIREGLYRHGWTLNRCCCKYDGNSIQMDLWGGTPRASLVHPIAVLSATDTKLALTLSRELVLRAEFLKQKCILNDFGEMRKSRELARRARKSS